MSNTRDETTAEERTEHIGRDIVIAARKYQAAGFTLVDVMQGLTAGMFAVLLNHGYSREQAARAFEAAADGVRSAPDKRAH